MPGNKTNRGLGARMASYSTAPYMKQSFPVWHAILGFRSHRYLCRGDRSGVSVFSYSSKPRASIVRSPLTTTHSQHDNNAQQGRDFHPLRINRSLPCHCWQYLSRRRGTSPRVARSQRYRIISCLLSH